MDVIVDIAPLDGSGPLQTDLVLLLKCEKSVNWVIQARDVIGKLEILVCKGLCVLVTHWLGGQGVPFEASYLVAKGTGTVTELIVRYGTG